MFRKMLLVMAAVAGVMAATGGSAEAGHCHHGGRGYGSGYGGYGGGYRGGYYGRSGYGYGGGVVIVPRPVYNYPVYPNYGNPYGGSPYGYGGYAPYGQSVGIRSGNFSLYLGR